MDYKQKHENSPDKSASGEPDRNAVDKCCEMMDEILALPEKRMREYFYGPFQMLHPLVQAMVSLRYFSPDKDELLINCDDARMVFHISGHKQYSYAPEPTPVQKRLANLYRENIDVLSQMVYDERNAIEKLDKQIAREQKEKFEEVTELLETCSTVTQAVINYEISKRNPSRGRSGFHFASGKKSYRPFTFCGYADTYEDWHGVAFMINAGCFLGRNPELYYQYKYGGTDFYLPFDDDLHLHLKNGESSSFIKLIERYSSGIKDLRYYIKFNKNLGHAVSSISFRLDSTAMKTVSLDGRKKTANGHILVLPLIGEFDVELGEIVDNELVPLHYDDFCMK